MNRVSVTLGPLWLAQERHVGLRYVVMYVLQSNIHWAHGNGDVLEAGEEVKEVMRSKGKLRGFDTLRSEL